MTSLLLMILALVEVDGIKATDVTLAREDVVLHGTLLSAPAASMLAIVHPGSGPTDRNGNQPGMQNNSLKLLAEALAAEGLSVLRYDKRAIGASTWAASEADIRPSHYIDDYAAWAQWGVSEAGYEQVVLIGHSEGALFALAAAAQAPVSAVVTVAGPGRAFGVLLREQTEGRRPGQIGVEFERILSELEAGRTVDEVSPILNPLFRPSVQPYLIELLALDPASLAADLEPLLLVIAGSSDLQVTRADFEALAAHASHSKYIDGMNHVLKAVEGDLAAQMASYADPELPLHPELVPAIAAFVGRE